MDPRYARPSPTFAGFPLPSCTVGTTAFGETKIIYITLILFILFAWYTVHLHNAMKCFGLTGLVRVLLPWQPKRYGSDGALGSLWPIDSMRRQVCARSSLETSKKNHIEDQVSDLMQSGL